MADNPSVSQIQARLHEIARMLRESPTVDDASRKTLAELVDGLTTTLQAGQVPPGEIAHLAEVTAHLTESLHHQHDSSQLSSVRDRFEQTVLSAEAKMPFLSGMVHRLSEALANIGI